MGDEIDIEGVAHGSRKDRYTARFTVAAQTDPRKAMRRRAGAEYVTDIVVGGPR